MAGVASVGVSFAPVIETVNVALWDGIRTKLRPMLERHRLELGNGIKVRLHGTADVWDVSGKFSFKVASISMQLSSPPAPALGP